MGESGGKGEHHAFYVCEPGEKARGYKEIPP